MSQSTIEAEALIVLERLQAEGHPNAHAAALVLLGQVPKGFELKRIPRYPRTNRYGLCVGCGAWAPARHPEAHDHIACCPEAAACGIEAHVHWSIKDHNKYLQHRLSEFWRPSDTMIQEDIDAAIKVLNEHGFDYTPETGVVSGQ